MIPDLCAQRAALNPDRPALYDRRQNRRWTFAQLDACASRVATLMARRGVMPGARVAVLCRNRGEFFELLFGCARVGAIAVPLNWRMPAVELRPLVEDAAPALLFFGAEDRATATKLVPAARLVGLDDDYAALCEACAAAKPRHRAPDDIWYLLYTSGTTGQPKAVIYTFEMALANYVNISQGMAIGRDDTTLNFLPLFHTAGINLVTLPTLLAGGQAIILPGFDLEVCIDLLRDGAIDTFFAVPAVYQTISTHPSFDELDLRRVRCFGCGGAPLTDDLITRFLERGAQVCNGMGMTETGPTAFFMDPAHVASKIGSVGKAQLLCEVRLVDRDGRDVASGDTGEVWFGGPGVTPGYWRNADATRDAFSADGWLRSGDLARRDQDGYYYVVGRRKEMFISGGENVYPAEVENTLASHPDILEAAVVPMPDSRWGEVGCAFVMARPGHEIPPVDRLRLWLCKRLATYKVPAKVVPVSEFPRTAAGKVIKHALKVPHVD